MFAEHWSGPAREAPDEANAPTPRLENLTLQMGRGIASRGPVEQPKDSVFRKASATFRTRVRARSRGARAEDTILRRRRVEAITSAALFSPPTLQPAPLPSTAGMGLISVNGRNLPAVSVILGGGSTVSGLPGFMGSGNGGTIGNVTYTTLNERVPGAGHGGGDLIRTQPGAGRISFLDGTASAVQLSGSPSGTLVMNGSAPTGLNVRRIQPYQWTPLEGITSIYSSNGNTNYGVQYSTRDGVTGFHYFSRATSAQTQSAGSFASGAYNFSDASSFLGARLTTAGLVGDGRGVSVDAALSARRAWRAAEQLRGAMGMLETIDGEIRSGSPDARALEQTRARVATELGAMRTRLAADLAAYRTAMGSTGPDLESIAEIMARIEAIDLSAPDAGTRLAELSRELRTETARVLGNPATPTQATEPTRPTGGTPS